MFMCTFYRMLSSSTQFSLVIRTMPVIFCNWIWKISRKIKKLFLLSRIGFHEKPNELWKSLKTHMYSKRTFSDGKFTWQFFVRTNLWTQCEEKRKSKYVFALCFFIIIQTIHYHYIASTIKIFVSSLLNKRLHCFVPARITISSQ